MSTPVTAPPDRFFAARRPLAPLWLTDRSGTAGNRVVAAVAWPVAIVLVLHGILVLAANGSVTDDFSTVHAAIRRFLTGTPVYNEAYHHVDPHYLYNPGATLLLTPLGLIPDASLARGLFVLANAAAIVAALALLTRLFGHRLSSAVFPVSVAVAFMTESVRNTLVFSNINGILLLVFVGFLWLWLHDRRWLAGLALGLAIVVKPMFTPLILLPLVRLDWRTVLGAVAVPVVTNAIAWPLVPGAGDYLSVVAPYLSQTRDYANSSLAGFAVYFDMPGALHAAAWLVLAALVGVGVLALLPWRITDPLFWLTTSSGLLLTGVFLLSSLGQQYYSMMLYPMIFTLLLRTSVFHHAPAWLAAFLFLAPVSWLSDVWPNLGRWLSTFTATAGWAMLIAVTATATVVWLRREGISREPVALNRKTASERSTP